MIEFKVSYFQNKYALLLGAAILIAGFFGYQAYSTKQLEREDAMETLEESFSLKCENGEWIEFPELQNFKQYEKFSGNAELKYDEKKDIFTDANGTQIFSTDKGYSLSFFMDRDARIEGYKIKDSEIYIKKIKCVGKEADRDILQTRRKLMNYVRDNINTLAPEKTSKGDWQVGTFYFVNDTDAYVQYESEGSFVEEAPYDSHLWLFRVYGSDRNIPSLETLAYIQENPEDPGENIVRYGKDLYKDVQNMMIYEFDDEANQWVLQ
ncbi:MAG: hypothetical protein C0412_05575 [Flavobacterium sp.]|nr:hypothetical protein [Flavobacterium sp.]